MPNGQVIQHPQWPPGHGPNRPVHPGPAPVWPQHPDWCDCGCDPCVCQPCPPSWSQDAIRCWNEMQQFRNMVAEIVQGELAKMPSGITGVTDGSDAKPGEVGEFVTMSGTASYPTTSLTQNVTVGVLAPGDWDVVGFGQVTSDVTNFHGLLSPVPAGFSGAMPLIQGRTGSEVIGPMTRALISVPTLVSFQMTTNDLGNGTAAGTMTMTVDARRVR